MTKITTDNNFGEITKFGDLAIGDMFVCAWFPETAFIRIDDGKNGKNEGINAAPRIHNNHFVQRVEERRYLHWWPTAKDLYENGRSTSYEL